jgi:hypothetical protein
MPQRFLRPGIRNSERWNSVDRTSQVLYIAILTLVDDFGRYDGREAVLHAECFTIWNQFHPDKFVTLDEVAASCSKLQEACLVDFYEVFDKKCLQVVQWQERVRKGVWEKWPKNPNSQQVTTPTRQRLQQVAASCSKLQRTPSPSPSPSPSIDTHTLARARDGVIPTLEDVKTVAAMRGVSEASAKSFFDHHQDNNLWINQFNRLIDWRSKLVSWATKDRATTNENSKTGSKPNPRNSGTITGPTDYSKAVPRAQRERAASKEKSVG